MLQIQNMPLPVEGFPPSWKAGGQAAGHPPEQFQSLELVRLSIDARKKSDVHYVCTVRAVVEGEEKLLARCRDKRVSPCLPPRPYVFPAVGRRSTLPPVGGGHGPAGLFAALFLARNGLPPIVLERGRPVEERTVDVEQFWATGVLDPSLQRAVRRGGARGTFSDGKADHRHPRPPHFYRVPHPGGGGGPGGHPLPTQAPHRHRRAAGGGAPPAEELLSLSCDVRFGHKLAGLDIRSGALAGLTVEGPGGAYPLPCDALVLSPGHSARDTFRMLLDAGVPMAPKPFAIGVRIEHSQAAVSEAQFGPAWERLPAADYKLACHCPAAAAPSPSASAPAGRWWPPPRRRAGW